jgi:hypothetical protein
MTIAATRRAKRRPGFGTTPSEGEGDRPQAERATAPDAAMIDEVYRDESKEIIADARKRLGEKATGMDFVYGDANKPIEYYMRRGYTPVVLENASGKTEQVTDRGDPLLMIEHAKELKRKAAPGILAAEQLTDTINGQSERYGVRDADGAFHSPERMTEE